MIKKSFALGIILLFILSAMSTLGIGYDKSVEQVVSVSSGPMDSPWPMYGHDVRHTGRSPYSTADNSGIEIWRFRTGEHGWINGGPVIDSDGNIYFGANDWNFYTLNPDGTLKWKYETDGKITSTPALSDDGVIYVGSWDDHLYALNPDGTLKWKHDVGSSIVSSPAIGLDGVIYIGNKGLYAINPDGTEKWYYQIGDNVYSNPAIGENGIIYAGSFDGYIHAIHPNGTSLWNFDTQGILRGSPTIADDGTVYIEGHGDLFALYPDNGTVKWILEDVGANFLSPSLDENGVLYFGTSEYMFYAVNPDGTVKWTYEHGDNGAWWKSSSAISSNGIIYSGVHNDYPHTGGTGDIIALNPDGTMKWSKTIAVQWIDSSPAIWEDGTVYIGSINEQIFSPDNWGSVGYLHAFGPVESNAPPDKPTVAGKTNGKAREEYFYSFVSIDPDNNPLQFFVDWGDGTHTDWTGGGTGTNYEMIECASSETIWIPHTYLTRGTYTIRAKARDSSGEESDWGELTVSMPRFKTTSMLYWFLEEHPILWKVLERVLS